MPRPLKVFQTHIGFYDLIVAAPSMKAAADAWHASPRLFAQGFAERTHDPDAVKAALEQPGVVLKRPHGKGARYKTAPEAPSAPRTTMKQKQLAASAAKERKQHALAVKRARSEAAHRARQNAAAELAAIAEQEAALRRRRQALRRKLHPAH